MLLLLVSVTIVPSRLSSQSSGERSTPPATRATQNMVDNVLTRRVDVSLRNVTVADALMTLRQRYGIPLAWSGDVVPANLRVTVVGTAMSVKQVLDRVLLESGLRVIVTTQGAVVVVPAAMGASPLRSAAENGNVANGRGALSDAASDDRAITRGLRATGVQQLDQVVVMGSSVNGGPEREQPTAVRVIGRDRITQINAPRLSDVVRLTMPGLVLWDRGPTGPPPPFAAVRGMASFTTRAIKTYIDGIEVASPELFTLLDGRSLEQVEMIRGPQGAALYGPDALNGILQIRTRHGTPGRPGITSQWQVHGGRYEREGLPSAQPVVDVSAGVSASSARSSVDISGAFAAVGRDSASREMRSWNVHAAGTTLLGSVLIEASAHAATYEFAAPRLAAAERAPDIPQQMRERTVAVTISQQRGERWRHALSAGAHAIEGDREPFRSPLLIPRLPAGASFEEASRLSVRYATTLTVSPVIEISSGAEYSARFADRERVRSTLMYDLTSLYSNTIRSTGAFAQTRVRLPSQITLSGGVRGENLSSVGPRLGTVWASTAGVSWTRSLGTSTVRGRAAYGRGIRPPEPGMRTARTIGVLRQLPNPALAPERQQGIELGVDWYAARGVSANVTWYDQRATDLFQQVSRRTTTPEAYQFQNVGVIRNRGLELDGGWQGARVTARASMHLPQSRVQSLSPFYTGELRPGDTMIEVPEYSGVVFVRLSGRSDTRAPARAAARAHPSWSFEAGATVLGPWTGYDWLLLARIERGQASRRDLQRDYWMRYDGIVRPYVSVSRALGSHHDLSLRIDNPGNTPALVRDNSTAPLGRVVMLGVARRQR